MDKVEFKKLLFKVAFCTMACDGHIDKREIDEMKAMDKNTSFFDGVDLSGELSELIEELGLKGAKVIEELFSTLRDNKLNPIQELLILEVAIRIINSDQKHDDNEIRFIHLLRAKLELHDETITDRFGDVALLRTTAFANNIIVGDSDARFAKNITLPELSEFNDAISDIGGASD
ncbi:MAG TPA: TerB family tellurite resistance protein [Rhodospirillales bacterium]|nr:TerB family tellurite resistance protein [Rhodospirillales bacterium]